MFVIIPAPVLKTLETFLLKDKLQEYDRTIHMCASPDRPHTLVLTASDKSSAFEWTLDYTTANAGWHPVHGFGSLDLLLNYPRSLSKIKKGLFELETETEQGVPSLEHVDGLTRTRCELPKDASTLPRAIRDIFQRIFEGAKPLAPGLAIPCTRCALDWNAYGFTKEFDPPAYMRFAGTHNGALAFKVPRFHIGLTGVYAKARMVTMQYVTGDAPDGTED